MDLRWRYRTRRASTHDGVRSRLVPRIPFNFQAQPYLMRSCEMYQLTQSSHIIRIVDKAEIPADPANRDYAEYLAWLDDGNEPHPATEPEIPVPHQVTRAQGKAALIVAGLWDDVLAYVEAIDDPQEKLLALVALNDTTHWNRD